MGSLFHSYLWKQTPTCRAFLLMVCLAVTRFAQAQTCSGPTAEVLISETFGTTATTTSLTDRTSYRYVTASCPNDGEYTLSSHVDGACFGVWHSIPADHTQEGAGGNMLIVNGSEQPGEFYRQSLPGLCGGTTYEFSVWGLNLLKPGNCGESLVPNLSILIETSAGRVLRRIDIGSISETELPTWRRFAVSFNTPDTDETVIVKLINNQGKTGCGNDLALDDIQLLRCGACPPNPVYVPDVFTPNNDQKNDLLAVYLTGATSASITIFDRWGKPLFFSNDLTRQWDGTINGQPCAEGHYTWTVTYQFPDSPTTTSTYSRTGRVLLVR